ncbi:MAG: ABC transporter permease [Propionibacteriaceae bacterium]|jgi:peptide/nickel transport system permease protein|nr:ABC transporter permease [Propionibacteriaceae bacterium]
MTTSIVTPGAAPEPEAPVHVTQVTESVSEAKLVFQRFIHHKAAMIALVVLLAILVFALTSIGAFGFHGWWPLSYATTGPVIDGGKPTLHFSLSPLSFSAGEHPFGQDDLGRDYFAIVMRGCQQSLLIAVTMGLTGTVVGVIIGSIAGYFRGWVEAVLMRLTDVVLTLPTLVVAAFIGRRIGSLGVVPLGLFLGLVSWTSLARMVRGQFLSLREKEFVEAARSVGAGPFRIIFRHILPNSVGIIIVNATLSIASAIILEAALSFLGFGVKPPDTSLGQVIGLYRQAMDTRPWLFWWPGLLIVAIALTVNFIGDGLRDAFDPQQDRG